MRTKLAIIPILLTVLISYSCSNTEEIVNDDIQENYFEAVGLKSIQTITKDNSIFTKFKNSDYYFELSKNVRTSSIKDVKTIDLVLFNNSTDKKMLKLRLDNKNDPTNGEEVITELAAVYSESKEEFVVTWIQEYVANKKMKTETVNHYWVDGSKFLTLTIDIENKKILTIESFESSSNARIKDMSWSACMEMAYNACSSDWQCAILCGLVFTECIAATAIACVF